MSELAKIVESVQELERLHCLNLEMLEQLHVACQWLISNEVQLPNYDKLVGLLSKSIALLNELQADKPKILQYGISRRKVTSRGWKGPADGEVPEPERRFSYLLVCFISMLPFSAR